MASVARLKNIAALALRPALLACVAWSSFTTLACSSETELPPDATGSGGSAGAGAGAGAGGRAAGGTAGNTTPQGGIGGSSVVAFTPVVLFGFDPGVVGTYGWAPDPNTGSVALVDEDRDPTHSPLGCLRFTAVFPAFDALGASSPVSVIHQFGDATTGTNRALQGGTKVHFWIRLASPSGLAASLGFFQPFVQGGAATTYANNFGYFTPETLADNRWHEFVLDVAGQTFMNDVWRVGVQLAPAAGQPAANGAADAGQPVALDAGGAGVPASAAPAPITLDVDYIWVE